MRLNLRLHSTVIWLALAALPLLHADVTLRYKTEVQLNPALPQQFAEQMMKSMDVNLPTSSTLQLKNAKLLNQSGKLASIADFKKKEITLLDAPGKRYATVPADQYGEDLARGMPQMPDAAKAAIASMKGHSESRATGHTATIQGVECEEREIVMTLDGPAMANMPGGPMMRMVMHIWTALASEVSRVPAVGEFAAYNLASIAGLDPATSMAKAFEQMPGFGEAFSGMMKELKSGGTQMVLRMQLEMSMPSIGAMMARMPAGGSPAGVAFDATAPLIHVTYEVAELSTAPIADSVFQVPQGYQSVPAVDIIKDLIKERMASATPAK